MRERASALFNEGSSIDLAGSELNWTELNWTGCKSWPCHATACQVKSRPVLGTISVVVAVAAVVVAAAAAVATFSICLSVSCHFCLGHRFVSSFGPRVTNQARTSEQASERAASQPIDWHCPQRPF